MRRDDIPALGALLFAGYRGTVDDEGESEAQAVAVVASCFDGEFGSLVTEASKVLEREGELLSASFVTLWQGLPLLAFAVTHPEHKGRGLARECVCGAMRELSRLGHAELHLFVTASNAPAIALYRRLGFADATRG